MILVVLIVLGLILGSFVTAVVWRLHEQELSDGDETTKAGYKRSHGAGISRSIRRSSGGDLSILKGRSMCTSCHHRLSALDLTPVFSWLILRGKCRYCGQPISWQYPVIELLLPAVLVISYFFWQPGWNPSGVATFIFWAGCLTFFTILAVYDLRWFLLPDRVIYPLIIVALAQVIVRVVIFDGGWATILSAWWGAFVIAGLFYAIYLVSQGKWIGLGDVKLGIALGLLVSGPWPALLLVFVASVLGSVVTVPLLILKRATATTHIPFGPLLLAATLVVTLWGTAILSWYNSLFVGRY